MMIGSKTIRCLRLLCGVADKRRAEKAAPPDKMPYNGQAGACYLPTVMPPLLAECLLTPPPLPPIGTLNDADPEHHVPTMNSNYLANIPYDERRGVNWTNSIGQQFKRSCVTSLRQRPHNTRLGGYRDNE
jgi:hypothetical protein